MNDSEQYYIIAFVVIFILLFTAFMILYFKYKRAKIYNRYSPVTKIDWNTYKSSRHLNLV